MGKIITLTNQRFGRLLVLWKADSRENTRHTFWVCLCNCGLKVEIDGTKLTNGHTKSCGCLKSDSAKNRMTTHGEANRTPEYQTWLSIRARCLKKGHADYADYGGRGIRICERWSKFENFLSDMGRRPSVKHSINRRDNNGDYTPSNCEWATASTQSRNKRNTFHVIYQGVRMSLADAAEKSGIKRATLLRRIHQGVAAARLFDTPRPWGR